MADELAKVLTIPDDVTAQMGKVIEKINEIESASNKMATTVNQAWKQLANGDVNLFLQKLASTQSAMTAISSTNLQVDTKSISNAATDAEKMAGAMGKVAQSAQNIGLEDRLNRQISDAITRYKELQQQVERYHKLEAQGRTTKLSSIRNAQAEKEMRILEAQIQVWQSNVNQIKQANSALKEQVAFLNGTNLEMQRSEYLLSRMTAFYKEQEKSSLASANADQKKAADAEKQYNALQSRLTTLQKKYNEIRMAEPFEGQEKAVEGYKTEISRVERELKRLEHEFPNIKTFSDQTWDAKRILNYVAQVEAVQKRLRKQYDDTANAYREANLKTLNTPEGALNFASSANTYARQVKAIQFLENAYKSLGKTEADVAKKNEIARAMRELRESVREADEQMGKFKDSARGLFNYSEQLGRAFSLLFSVSAIKNYIRQIREVTAEFELQRVALGSLLQSQDKANELFGQITNLAVRSPFTIKELNTYTKQLAAYNIQYENLFDTTKMLADVSAGLGVDIGRLILAFGQVKAATVLRGTEVRQFTEAGFGILGELAKYYTELEGKLVSVGDVQDRITKKMVKFADVEEIFKRVTSAGGMFYNMQEKMADTLYGKWSNLTDRIDLMLNEIGQSNKGVFNLLVDVAATLAENWELVATAISLAVPAFASFKIQSAMAVNNLKWFGKEASVASIAVRGLGTALKSLLSPLSLVFLALEGAVYIWKQYNIEAEQATARISKFNEQSKVVADAAKEFAKIERTEKNANETDKQFAERLYDDKRASLVKFRSELQGIGFEISNMPDIKTLTNEQVDEEIKSLQKRARAYIDFQNQITFAIDRGNQGWRYFGDNFATIDKIAKELDSKSSKVASAINYNLNQANLALEQIKDNLDPDIYKEFTEALTQKDDEDIVDYYNRVAKAVLKVQRNIADVNFFGDTEEANRQYGLLLKNLHEYIEAFSGLGEGSGRIERKVKKTLQAMADEFHTSIDGLKAMAQENDIEFKTALDNSLAQKTWSKFVKSIVSRTIYAKLELKPTTSKDSGGKELADWQKKILGDDKLSKLFSKDFVKKFSSYQEFLDGIQKSYDDATADVEKYNKQVAKGENLSKQELQSAQKRAIIDKQLAEQQADAVGLILEKTKKETKEAKTRNDYLEESVSLIEKMGKEYDDALDSMGKTAAKTDISTRYSSLLSDLADKSGMDGAAFVANLSFDTSGIISALQKVADAAAKAGATEAEQAAREAIAEIQGKDVKIEVKANVDNFERDLDNVLAQYQLGKELSKLGLGKELTESLFNFESVNLDDLRAFVDKQKQLYTDKNGELAKDYIEVFKDAEKKITDLQNKETEERIKRYASYLKKSVSERVRLEQEAAKKIAEVEAESKFTSAQKASIKSNIQKETQEALDKLSWNDFKSSGMYLDLFENLDQASEQAIDNMLAELEKMRNSLSNLPPEQLKEIINQMEKLREIKIEKAGFGGLIKNIREGVKAARELPELEKQLQDARDTQGVAESLRDEDARRIEQAEKEYDLAVKTYGVDSDQAKQAKKVLQWEENMLAISNEEVENGKQNVQNLENAVSENKKLKKLSEMSVMEMLDRASAVGDAITNLHGALTDVFGELPTGLEDAFIYAEGLFAGVDDLEKGIGEIMSGKVLSGAINTLAGVFRTIGGIFGIGLRDVRREREIEREVELVEELQRSYEKLEEAIDSAYSSSTYDQAQDTAIANLEAQNKALERAQAAERDKKKTDQDRIDEWERQKLDNLKKIAEFERQAIEAYGGFGSNDNIKSAAEDFVSAWMDAFNETGAGLDALSDKMDEWLNNAIQRQLLMRLSDQYITPLLEQFDAMFSETSDQGRIMTKEEIDAWKRLYEENSKAFDDKAKAYLDALDIKPTGVESEMSGLQRGIEGVTETTAQALEALLNSMRFYVSDSNNLLRQFYMSFISADETMNPMLYELKQHTTLLNAIHTLLNSTTKMTNNNGRALKVLMM